MLPEQRQEQLHWRRPVQIHEVINIQPIIQTVQLNYAPLLLGIDIVSKTKEKIKSWAARISVPFMS